MDTNTQELPVVKKRMDCASQRQALASLDGWHMIENRSTIQMNGDGLVGYPPGGVVIGSSKQKLPDYLYDMSAIHGLELKLGTPMVGLYFYALKEIIQSMVEKGQEDYDYWIQFGWMFEIVIAHPRQRAEAILKVFKKWNPDV